MHINRLILNAFTVVICVDLLFWFLLSNLTWVNIWYCKRIWKLFILFFVWSCGFAVLQSCGRGTFECWILNVELLIINLLSCSRAVTFPFFPNPPFESAQGDMGDEKAGVHIFLK